MSFRKNFLGNKMNQDEVLNQLIQDLFSEDELGAVIRSHIRIEYVLNTYVDKSAPNPKHINKLRLDFDQTVTLAITLGLDEEYATPLRVLGKLRNDFAHKPDMHLSKSSVNNLYSQLNSVGKDSIQKLFNTLKERGSLASHSKFSEMPPTEQLKMIVVTIWAQINAALKQLFEALCKKEKLLE